jgi:hypothetical protein
VGDLHEIVIAHDRYVTASVSAYEDRLDQLVAIATARTIADLSRRLTIDKNGVIAGTASNRRVLRSVDDVFMSELEDAGFSALNRSYAGQFAGQLPFLHQILDKISDSLKTPLPDVRDAIRVQEKQTLTAQQASTVDSLQGAAQAVAAGAKRQAMFGFAGLKVADLAATLSKSLEKTTAQAETIADTAQVMFYRTATAQAFAVIEKDLPEMEIRYEYEGPDDSLTRPFCDRLLHAAKTYTREEIGEMNNHQLPNVLITAGGWNCRHQWMVAL